MDNPLRRLRTELGLTQIALGEQIGLSRIRIAQVEAGERLGPDSLLVLFERFPADLERLGLTYEDFLRARRIKETAVGETAVPE